MWTLILLIGTQVFSTVPGFNSYEECKERGDKYLQIGGLIQERYYVCTKTPGQ